jgi:hypothetical protein
MQFMLQPCHILLARLVEKATGIDPETRPTKTPDSTENR